MMQQRALANKRLPKRALLRRWGTLIALVLFSAGCAPAEPPATSGTPSSEPDKLPIKSVVVTMFEHGEVTGDRPGELQYWVEDFPFTQSLDFPLGEYPLFYNADKQVLAICVGGGIPNATASIMALGLDSRFDLRQAYWLIAGIAGGDPLDTTLGSAAWANHVVDGDLLYEIDAREIPASWPYGIIPLGGEAPATSPEDIYTGWTVDTIHFALNADLATWAYETSKSVSLIDTPEMQAYRAQYEGLPKAQAAPSVHMGDTLSASTYWHGELLNNWANDWIKLYAGQDTNFVTSNMEDSGTLTALHRLDRTGLIDADRVMVLRTISNFTYPPPGKTADWSATADYPNRGQPALRAAFTVGAEVVNEISDNWLKYAEDIPARTDPQE